MNNSLKAIPSLPPNKSGKAHTGLLFALLAAFMIGYLLEPSLNFAKSGTPKTDQNPDETAATSSSDADQLASNIPQPDTPSAPDPTPDTKDKSPSPEPADQTAGNPDPSPSGPIVTDTAKTKVDLLLEEHFPLPDFLPLEKIVNNWQKIPRRAMPEMVTVNQSVTYRDEDDGSALNENSGHLAVPIAAESGLVTLGHPTNPDLQTRIPMEQTDLKERVTNLYQEKTSSAVAKVLTARKENRAKAVAFLEERENNPAKPSDADLDLADNSASGTPTNPEISKLFQQYNARHSGDYWPSPANGKSNNSEHEMPMGPIGGLMSVSYDDRKATIIDLWDKGPGANAGLKTDDIIVRIAGKTVSSYSANAATGGEGAPEQLGDEILEAQENDQPLELTVERNGERLDISIPLPPAPAFQKELGDDCLRSLALSHAAAEYLVKAQTPGGKWPGNQYTHAWCGLSLLATGDKKYAKNIEQFAHAIAHQYDFGTSPTDDELMNGTSGNGAAKNWFVTMNGIFLAEYYLATGDTSVLNALNYCCRAMEARIHPDNGRFGHSQGPEHLPYGKKGLVIINVHAHLMWALESIIKGQKDYDWTTWDLSYDKAVVPSMGGDGAVGYNFSARGGSQSSPRTGCMLTALTLAGKDRSDQRAMAGWLSENHLLFPNVHAMTFIGPAYGFMGLKSQNTRKFQKAFENYHWLFSLVQPANYQHGSYYFCDRGNSGGDRYCNARIVGNCMTIMVLNSYQDDTLWIYGNREKNWFK